MSANAAGRSIGSLMFLDMREQLGFPTTAFWAAPSEMTIARFFHFDHIHKYSKVGFFRIRLWHSRVRSLWFRVGKKLWGDELHESPAVSAAEMYGTLQRRCSLPTDWVRLVIFKSVYSGFHLWPVSFCPHSADGFVW